MANFTAGTSFSDGVTNDVTAAKLNALVADAVPTSNLSLNSTTGTIATFNSTTPTFLGAITASTNTINVGSGQIYKDASGNVGVGIASPTTKLHVYGTGSGTRSYADGDAVGQTLFLQDVGGNGGQILFGTQQGPTTGIRGITVNGTGPAGDLIFLTRATSGNVLERMSIDSAGGLYLVGSTAQKASGTTWSNPSDVRIKKNIRDYEKGLDSLMQIRVREWEYNGKAGTVNDSKNKGVIADEIESVLPDTVSTYTAKLNQEDENDSQIKKFDASEVTWLLVKAVQELSAKVTALEAA